MESQMQFIVVSLTTSAYYFMLWNATIQAYRFTIVKAALEGPSPLKYPFTLLATLLNIPFVFICTFGMLLFYIYLCFYMVYAMLRMFAMLFV
jgi:hypothetical protein